MEVSMASLSPLIEEVIGRGNSAEITVEGTSMQPFLRHRVSRVRLYRADRVKNGDVVLYRRDNGAFVLHRIVGIRDGAYTMCGDNQYVLEHGIHRDQILAIMTAYARDGVHFLDSSSFGYSVYRVLWMRTRFLRRLVGKAKRGVARLIRRS